MAAVLEISGLRKTYRSRRGGVRHALDGFDMRVEAGQVHGFLGPNGSGKTTTLRTLLGLVAANDGRMQVLGRSVPEHLPEVTRRVGAIVESPQFFPHFTARDTLSLLAQAGEVAPQRVPAVLELVGLADRAGDRVRTYSLGMRQRLAVASALLKEPELLILDEPANGLDPAGIREMRTLMRDLVASGTTVVLSSHILGEIQLICDSVTIIARGRRVTAGPVAEVLAAHSGGGLRVRLPAATDLPAAEAALTAEVARTAAAPPGVGGAASSGVGGAAPVTVARHPDHLLVYGVSAPEWVTRTLAAADLYVSELAPVTADLESVFLELTGDGEAGAV
ncbi:MULTISPECIES: ABC transporter ATP-binding protein [unclassified Solwaraspora]|uniref:ABC transporter ATP-binding protein n=1 Tax=unclassified Solwaraspora TaxID=2627926 RepID=UPI00259B5F1D|nr:ATP-binding cassette domain-containing protein [Solwaraspora sp. WMMA2056]WJK41039.1 ATP-binding cassette domain-containing protein [Solwaraspora sp. WMMA2056]